MIRNANISFTFPNLFKSLVCSTPTRLARAGDRTAAGGFSYLHRRNACPLRRQVYVSVPRVAGRAINLALCQIV